MLTQNKFLTDQELKFLISKLNCTGSGRDTIIISLLLYTGARQCEITDIRKRDIAEGCITLRGRKGSCSGTLPLPLKFYKKLVRYASKFEEDSLLFNYNTSTFRRIWYKFRPNSNKGLHCLRHTFGIKFYKHTKDIYSTKLFLRHKSINNTMHYLNYVESNKQMKEKINGMWH